MKINELEAAVKTLFDSKRSQLSEEYQIKLDGYAERTTNVNHLITLLNCEDLSKALDDRESKRESNLKYQNKKASEENTFENLFKKNFDVELKNADFDSLAKIKDMLDVKIFEVDQLMKTKKLSKIAELEEKLKKLREL